MKLGDIIRDANRNLLRNKGRTILTIIAIFIGALTLTITNGIGAGVSNYIDQQLGNIGASDVLVVQAETKRPGGGPEKYDADKKPSGRGDIGPFISTLAERDVDEISSVPGIISASPQITVSPDYIAGMKSDKYQLTVNAYVSGTNLALASGTHPSNESSQNQIVLLPDYPAVLGFASSEAALGQKVTLGITSALGVQSEVEATVVGVAEKTLTALGGATINQALAKDLYTIQSDGLPPTARDHYFAVVARIDPHASEASIADIKNKLSDKGYSAMTVKDRIGAFKQAIDAIIMVLNAFAIIALLAASLGIVNTLLMAVQERTKEIGLMKAMGMSGRKIFSLFSLEAILIGFWGSLLGSLAGIAVGTVANRVASNTFLKDLPGFELTAFSLQSVAIIMLIIMAIAFIAGTLPARRASKKDPIEALRYE